MMSNNDGVIITGAFGFVGRHLLSIISETEIIDRLILIDKVTPPDDIVNFLKKFDKKVEIIITRNLLQNHEVSRAKFLICLAGATSVDAGLTKPRKAIASNISISLNLAEWARCLNPHAKIIYVSSDEVLGPSLVPLDEESPLNPSQPYSVSKTAAELILHNYRDIYHLNIVTLRSCNLVGYGQKKPKLIPTTVDAIINNVPIPIHGDGNQMREWMDVKDLCSAIQLLIRNDSKPQIFQASSGIKLSVNEVVKIIANQLNKPFNVKHVSDRLVQDKCYSMNTNKLREIGWSHSIDPISAIRKTSEQIAQDYFMNV